MTLYEIEQALELAIEELLDCVDEETGEVDEEKMHAVDALKMARAEKLEGIGCFIKNLMAEADAIKEESKKLAERAKIKENRVERLKRYVADNLLANNETKFEGVKVAYSFRKSEAVDILDESAIPSEYLKTKTEISPDKTAIKKAIKAGKEVAGAVVKENMNLQIK